MDWRHAAACRTADPEVFFPVDEDKGDASPGVRTARAVCHRCPVRAECLAWATASGQGVGVWGGLTTAERRNGARRDRRARTTATA